MKTSRLAAMAAVSLIPLAAAVGHHARAAEPSAVVCPAGSDGERPYGTWTTRDFDPTHASRLIEVDWFPEPGAGGNLGRIQCAFEPYISRFPLPRLISNFLVQRPVTPGWMQPRPQDDWLLCSGATMTHFDTTQCPFVPAPPPAEPKWKTEPKSKASISPF